MQLYKYIFVFISNLVFNLTFQILNIIVADSTFVNFKHRYLFVDALAAIYLTIYLYIKQVTKLKSNFVYYCETFMSNLIIVWDIV